MKVLKSYCFHKRVNIQKSYGNQNEENRIYVKNDEKYCKIPQGVGCREKPSKRFLFFQN